MKTYFIHHVGAQKEDVKDLKTGGMRTLREKEARIVDILNFKKIYDRYKNYYVRRETDKIFYRKKGM